MLAVGEMSVQGWRRVMKRASRALKLSNTAWPFSGSHEKMMEYFGKGFSVDVNSALDWLDTEPDSMERNVLKYQIERYKGILN